MIAKYFKTPQNLKILVVLALLISNWCYSQDTSQAYLEILNANNPTEEKAQQFDALLKKHIKRQDYNLLLADRYEILKWYFKQGQIDKTIQLNRANLSLMDSLQIEDSALIRKNTYSLGYYLRMNNQTEQATELFNTLIQTNIVDEFSFKSYSSLAQMAYKNDDFYAAATLYENGRELAKIEDNLDYILSFSQGAGYAHKVINTEKSLNRGVQITKDAIALIEHKEGLTIRDNYFLYNLYDLLGNLYNDRDDFNFKQSLSNYVKAEKIAKELNDSIRLASVYNNIGYLYLHDSQKEANDYFDIGLTYNPDETMLSLLHRNKAEYYLKNNKKSLALTHIQKSIYALTKIDTLKLENLPKIEILENQDYKFLLLSSIIDKAKIWIELSDQGPFEEKESYRNALTTLKLADEIVDIIRLVTSANKSKLYWRETASDIYVNATKVCYELNLPEEAFYFIEKNKALLLLEDLNKKQLMRNSNIPESIVNREATLSAEIIKRSISESESDSLIKAKEAYRRFMDTLDSKYRIFFKVQQPANVITLETLQRNLESNEAYLEFILNNENGYGLLITKARIEFYTIDNCNLLKQNVQQFRKLISKPILNLSDQNEYNSVSNNIYESLFPDQIKDLIKDKSLTIVPDYYLQNIPFEALQTNSKTYSYLIFEHEISYAYSASLLDNNTQITRVNEQNLVGFAPINFKELTTLKNSKTELDAIDNLFTSELFIEEEATTSNFTNNLNGYQIIHIASHANSGTAEGVSPWIQFHDNRINLQELYQLDHSAELVVLSACETSLGENYKGEGVMSLTRGFFSSGANSVISTLWKINDKSSTNIMKNFYTNLNNGHDKSSALHEAKLSYINANELSGKSPYYWASFILIGNTDSIAFGTSHSYIYYIILGCIILIIIVFFKFRKKS